MHSRTAVVRLEPGRKRVSPSFLGRSAHTSTPGPRLFLFALPVLAAEKKKKKTPHATGEDLQYIHSTRNVLRLLHDSALREQPRSKQHKQDKRLKRHRFERYTDKTVQGSVHVRNWVAVISGIISDGKKYSVNAPLKLRFVCL